MEFTPFDRSAELNLQDKSYEEWQVQERRFMSPQSEDRTEEIKKLADVLTPMFMFLADAHLREDSHLDDYAWVLLYAFRPDLIYGESIEGYSGRRGITPSAVQGILRRLLRDIPGLKIDTITRYGSSEKLDAEFLAYQAKKRKQREWSMRSIEKKRLFKEARAKTDGPVISISTTKP